MTAPKGWRDALSPSKEVRKEEAAGRVCSPRPSVLKKIKKRRTMKRSYCTGRRAIKPDDIVRNRDSRYRRGSDARSATKSTTSKNSEQSFSHSRSFTNLSNAWQVENV